MRPEKQAFREQDNPWSKFDWKTIATSGVRLEGNLGISPSVDFVGFVVGAT
jgi:hypothetical protein